MSEVQIARTIQAPVEDVFRTASDFSRAAERIPAIQRIEMLTDGPTRVGTRFRETRIMFGREATEEMTVTELEAPRRLVLDAESHGCHYRTVMTFDEVAGGTEMRWRFQVRPLTFTAKVMGFLMKPMMNKMVGTGCGKDLDALKASIESRGGAGTES